MSVDYLAHGAVLLAVFAFVGIAAFALSLRGRSDPVLRRLRARKAEVAPPAEAPLTEVGLAIARGMASIAQVTSDKEASLSRLRRRLVQAGFRREAAVHTFLAAKVGIALALPVGFLAVESLLAEGIDLAVPIAVWLCTGGFFLPNLWISSRIQSRRQSIERGLPDALDLLVTCVEAGLGLDAALVRVSGDLELSWPLLAEELNLTFLEIKAGIPRTEAFRRLFERTGVDELKSLAATLAQAEMFGTSIAVSLRVQASGLRIRRMYRAEERAAVVAVKMTVPLVLCILPSLLAVVMGPAAVNIYNSLFTKLGGG